MNAPGFAAAPGAGSVRRQPSPRQASLVLTPRRDLEPGRIRPPRGFPGVWGDLGCFCTSSHGPLGRAAPSGVNSQHFLLELQPERGPRPRRAEGALRSRLAHRVPGAPAILRQGELTACRRHPGVLLGQPLLGLTPCPWPSQVLAVFQGGGRMTGTSPRKHPRYWDAGWSRPAARTQCLCLPSAPRRPEQSAPKQDPEPQWLL